MEILITAERIQQRVAEMAKQINADYRRQPVTIMGVLTGCILFLADLIRRLEFPLNIDLIQASSYRSTSTTPGELHIQAELAPEVRDRHILLVDDILDTGQTLHHLVRQLHQLGAASVKVGVLLRKEGRQRFALEPDYCGFSIPNVFVVGYGLDYNGEYRQLPHIAVADELGRQSSN